MNKKPSTLNPYKAEADLSRWPGLSLTRRLAAQAMHYEITYLGWERKARIQNSKNLRQHDK